MGKHPDYASIKGLHNKNKFKAQWAAALWTQSHKEQSKTKSEELNHAEGNEAEFISYIKLEQELGKDGARRYARACAKKKTVTVG